MENLIKLLSSLSQNNKDSSNTNNSNPIPKEIIDQYPYGEFPIRYTKVGQEDIRKNSENRFAYTESPIPQEKTDHNNFDLQSLMPIVQLLSNKNTSQKDMFKVFSSLLFKDKPELQNILDIFSKSSKPSQKHQEIDNTNPFPNTNRVNISSLQKIK